jgi:hypothetical protein
VTRLRAIWYALRGRGVMYRMHLRCAPGSSLPEQKAFVAENYFDVIEDAPK